MKQIIKSLILCGLCAMVSLSVVAVPAKPISRRLTLQDGRTVEATLRGDETLHFYVSEEGDCYRLEAEGKGCPVNRDALLQEWTTRSLARNRDRGKAMARNDFVQPFTGQRRGLVILVGFADKPFGHTRQQLDDQFNLEGYSAFQHTGSVHDYFLSQSYGQFDLQFDVVGPVALSHDMRYYGGNDYYGDDLRAATMIIEACRLADDLGTDFSRYDWDGNGWVEQVFVIYAGYGENQGASANTIWPHEWLLSAAQEELGDGTGAMTLDGVHVDHYACSNELCGTSGSQLDGIGCACHEFAHCLGIPDFYDPNENAFGMNRWSIMDTGCYNGQDATSGTTPCGFTSFERMACGWLTPQPLVGACDVTAMPPLDEQPCAYILYNDACKDEFYLLENRQKVGWDQWGFGHGMLILHVDYYGPVWEANTVNAMSNHPRMTIIPADNQFRSGMYVTASDLAGDPWPGTSGNTALTDTSKPAATVFNVSSTGSRLMQHPIEDIREDMQTGCISFSFEGGTAVSSLCPDTPLSHGCYDLQGRPISLPFGRTLYLENGRKVLR